MGAKRRSNMDPTRYSKRLVYGAKGYLDLHFDL